MHADFLGLPADKVKLHRPGQPMTRTALDCTLHLNVQAESDEPFQRLLSEIAQPFQWLGVQGRVEMRKGWRHGRPSCVAFALDAQGQDRAALGNRHDRLLQRRFGDGGHPAHSGVVSWGRPSRGTGRVVSHDTTCT